MNRLLLLLISLLLPVVSPLYGSPDELPTLRPAAQIIMDGVSVLLPRIYDPQSGRFLSADPIVQQPENLQAYNRYSYVLNNPLTHVNYDGYQATGTMSITAAAIYGASRSTMTVSLTFEQAVSLRAGLTAALPAGAAMNGLEARTHAELARSAEYLGKLVDEGHITLDQAKDIQAKVAGELDSLKGMRCIPAAWLQRVS